MTEIETTGAAISSTMTLRTSTQLQALAQNPNCVEWWTANEGQTPTGLIGRKAGSFMVPQGGVPLPMPPTGAPDGPNGNYRFNTGATGAYLATGTPNTLIPLAAGFSLVAVCRPNPTPSGGPNVAPGLLFGNGDPTSTRMAAGFTGYEPTDKLYFQANGTTLASSAVSHPNASGYICAIFSYNFIDATHMQVGLRVNGVTEILSAITNWSAYEVTNASLELLGSGSTTAGAFQGDVVHLGILNVPLLGTSAASVAALAAVEAYVRYDTALW